MWSSDLFDPPCLRVTSYTGEKSGSSRKLFRPRNQISSNWFRNCPNSRCLWKQAMDNNGGTNLPLYQALRITRIFFYSIDFRSECDHWPIAARGFLYPRLMEQSLAIPVFAALFRDLWKAQFHEFGKFSNFFRKIMNVQRKGKKTENTFSTVFRVFSFHHRQRTRTKRTNWLTKTMTDRVERNDGRGRKSSVKNTLQRVTFVRRYH